MLSGMLSWRESCVLRALRNDLGDVTRSALSCTFHVHVGMYVVHVVHHADWFLFACAPALQDPERIAARSS
jgi:hypothetical protein